MLDTKKNGSVMIVGGGVTGMQSALDLADAGYYVYLVEKTGAIGGAMAHQRLLDVNHRAKTG
jgi:heterodisulfide reductase subunit A-like polyferredoxin